MISSQKLIRFAVVGLSTALLQTTLLYLGVELASLDPTLTSSAVFVIIVTYNYLMHYSWTFAEPAPHTKTLGRYLFMIFCGFIYWNVCECCFLGLRVMFCCF